MASATAAMAALTALLVYGIVQIIEQSRARSAVRERSSERRMSSQISIISHMVEEVFDAYLQIDGDEITVASPTIQRLLGYTPQQFQHNPLNSYLHPDETQTAQRLRPSEPPSRNELRIRHSDGRWVWVEAYCVPDLVSSRANRFFVALRDYEQQRRVSDQLTQVQRLESMGSMAAAIAHDFNNMLTVIMGLADSLPDSESREDILSTTNKASALTNKLLTFGHNVPHDAEVHDLSYLIHQLSPLIRHMLDSRFILIEEYTDEPALVRIVESEFEQVLVNLVNNAREAMPEGGELEISLYHEENSGNNFVVLEVNDTGCGMDSDTQAKIFDPFFSTKQDKVNSGLGLSSCYGIASRYGGSIEVNSQVGGGTTMRVRWPLAETRDYEPVIEVLDSERFILVVDDDPGVLKVVQTALTRAGHAVRGFNNAREAIEHFSPHKTALLVTDMVMDGINGSELAEELRRRAPQLPVLFISSFPKEDVSDWTSDRYTSYLAKPFRGEEVVNRVTTLTGSSEPIGARRAQSP